MDLGNHPALRAGLTLAKGAMNRYYSLTDSSAAYRVSMSANCYMCHNFDVADLLLQFYIRDTSWNTLKKQAGKCLGSTKLADYVYRFMMIATHQQQYHRHHLRDQHQLPAHHRK